MVSGGLPGAVYGEIITQFDAETERLVRAVADWKEFPEAIPFIPTAEEWAEHVDHVIKPLAPTMLPSASI
jgi:membrane dipeptidase